MLKRLLELWALADLCRKCGLNPYVLRKIVSLHYLALLSVKKNESEKEAIFALYAAAPVIVHGNLNKPLF